MGRDCKKSRENIYFRCRKEAALYNDSLSSRENAAYMLGVSVSSLADYELGNTKVVPVDKVVLMADLYNAPQLLNDYCVNSCPIGCGQPIATETGSLESIVVKVIKNLREETIGKIKDTLIDFATESSGDVKKINEVLMELDKIALTVSEAKLSLCKAVSDAER